MSAVKSLFAQIFRTGSRLSTLETMVLDCVNNCLDAQTRKLWDMQVRAINKVQRLPEGVEVNFYRMKGGRPSFDEALGFPNKTIELLVAKVAVSLPDMAALTAEVWSARGFLSSIEYVGNANYFEEAMGTEPRPEFCLKCELFGDLAISA